MHRRDGAGRDGAWLRGREEKGGQPSCDIIVVASCINHPATRFLRAGLCRRGVTSVAITRQQISHEGLVCLSVRPSQPQLSYRDVQLFTVYCLLACLLFWSLLKAAVLPCSCLGINRQDTIPFNSSPFSSFPPLSFLILPLLFWKLIY